MTRSNRPDVRNPILACPEAIEAMERLDPDQAEALAAILDGLSRSWRDTAEKLWRKHKPPMASYWKINAVNARHIARAIRSLPRQGDLSL